MAFLPAIPAILGAIGSAVGSATAAVGGTASALSIGSSVLTGVGAIAGGVAEKQAADYNASVAEMQGRQAQEQAALKASEIARGTRQTMAAARAGAAISGFEQSGSVSDLLSQAQRQGDLDYLTAVYDGSVQNAGLQSQANLDRSRGKASLAAGFIGAGSAALGGVSDFYGRRTRQLTV